MKDTPPNRVIAVTMQGSRQPIRGAKRFIAHPRRAGLNCRGGGPRRERGYVECLRAEGRPTSVFPVVAGRGFRGRPLKYYQ
jgi:hypothetical protein